MKLIKKSRLWYRQEKSDKVYEVDLGELAGRKDERYVVNFRYGRRANKLREGGKTPDPVDLATAETIFTSASYWKIKLLVFIVILVLLWFMNG